MNGADVLLGLHPAEPTVELCGRLVARGAPLPLLLLPLLPAVKPRRKVQPLQLLGGEVARIVQAGEHREVALGHHELRRFLRLGHDLAPYRLMLRVPTAAISSTASTCLIVWPG